MYFFFSAATSLFPDFLASFQKHYSSAVFELLDDYQTLCQEKVVIYSINSLCALILFIMMCNDD